MTPEPTPLVTVLPCDREAAAKFCRSVGRLSTRDADNVLAGLWDETEDVQAFARHRLAALEAAAKVAEARIMLAHDGYDLTGSERANSGFRMLATAIRSLSQPVEESAGASVGPGYSAEPEPEVSAHVMRPSSLNHGNAQCVHCHASDLEIALVLGPVCPNAPQGDAQTPTALRALSRTQGNQNG